MKCWQVSVSKRGALESLFPTYSQGCCFGQLAAMLLTATSKQNPVCFCTSSVVLVLGKRLPSASCCISCHPSKGIWNFVDWWETLLKSAGFPCIKKLLPFALFVSKAPWLTHRLAEMTGRPMRVVGWYHSHPHITVWPSHVGKSSLGLGSIWKLTAGTVLYSQYYSIYWIFRAAHPNYQILGSQMSSGGTGLSVWVGFWNLCQYSPIPVCVFQVLKLHVTH